MWYFLKNDKLYIKHNRPYSMGFKIIFRGILKKCGGILTLDVFTKGLEYHH